MDCRAAAAVHASFFLRCCMNYVDDFEELAVYRKSVELAERIFVMTKRLPSSEAYCLAKQVRRSSRSIGAQIAEAWAKRRYRRHFVAKLTDADGEQRETRHWIRIAKDCKYLSEADAGELTANVAEIGGMLQGMIRTARRFCRGQPDHD